MEISRDAGSIPAASIRTPLAQFDVSGVFSCAYASKTCVVLMRIMVSK
jgi:hypothetical protein